ncbi:hypothetical protein [Selenomonas ruminantium]|uniref:Uncharacterized protein n=1 Tax=Selenomonas ruminantium TaxID=971 RepID=A0A1K1NI63_SELRU|nr:hypothetical protein [Selenomonas ruminantium]SFW35128.1 hypothetical protein SAMN02910323_1398 [Selenomonas ruminantium]
MRKMDYKAFIIALIGLALGKILNRSFGNNDMILVVMGAASLLLGGYYYWKKEHQDCIVLMLVFAISCFIPVTLGQYSEDIRYLSLIGSVAFMIMGINVFVVWKSRRESDAGKKKFMRIAAGINTVVLLCFCGIALYAF